MITLEVWADRGVRGQKSKLRSRIHSGLGGEARGNPGSLQTGRAAEPGGQAHSHPGGRLLAEAMRAGPAVLQPAPPW